MNQNPVVGTYTGTGAAINLQLGFVPDYVRIINVTDGNQSWEWTSEMTDGHAFQAVNNASTQFSRITSNGVSKYQGTSGGNAAGITVGTALSTNAKVYHYIAYRKGPGVN
jgi:hypothetical protein